MALRSLYHSRGSADILGIVVLLFISLAIIGATAVFGVILYVPEPTTTNPSAEFTFEHDDSATDTMIIDHTSGDRIPSDAVRIDIEDADPRLDDKTLYWANFTDNEYVYENSIEITRDSLDINDLLDLSEASIELHVEDEDDGEETRVGRWPI